MGFVGYQAISMRTWGLRMGALTVVTGVTMARSFGWCERTACHSLYVCQYLNESSSSELIMEQLFKASGDSSRIQERRGREQVSFCCMRVT